MGSTPQIFNPSILPHSPRQRLDSGIVGLFSFACSGHTYMTSLATSTPWACWTVRHVGPNKHTLICALYEYSDTAVCDTEIAAGVFGPLRYPRAMPGQKPLHLGQDRPSRPWTTPNPIGETHTRVVYDSINTFSSLQHTWGHLQYVTIILI